MTLAGGSSICFGVCVFLAIAWVVACFMLAPAFTLDDDGGMIMIISICLVIWAFSVFFGFVEGWVLSGCRHGFNLPLHESGWQVSCVCWRPRL